MKLLIASLSALLIAANAFAQTTEEPTQDTEKRLEEAHKRLEQAAREIAELSGRGAMDRMVFLGRNPNRAMLGIGIGDGGDKQSDEGVTVLSVSPDGPAAKAGLKAGDVIVDLNGKSLKGDKDKSREKLLVEMGKLSPGDEATIRYLRDGKSATAKVTVNRLPHQEMHVRRIEIPDMEHVMRDRAREFERFNVFIGSNTLGDMELVTLTPKLGHYFGTEKGLLIVRAPDDKDIKLEDGDVLIDIDGRAPSDPGHAFRILRSYQAGEKVTLNVLRQRKKVAVNITVPERERRGIRAPRPINPPAPPAPSAPSPAV